MEPRIVETVSNALWIIHRQPWLKIISRALENSVAASRFRNVRLLLAETDPKKAILRFTFDRGIVHRSLMLSDLFTRECKIILKLGYLDPSSPLFFIFLFSLFFFILFCFNRFNSLYYNYYTFYLSLIDNKRICDWVKSENFFTQQFLIVYIKAIKNYINKIRFEKLKCTTMQSFVLSNRLRILFSRER